MAVIVLFYVRSILSINKTRFVIYLFIYFRDELCDTLRVLDAMSVMTLSGVLLSGISKKVGRGGNRGRVFVKYK